MAYSLANEIFEVILGTTSGSFSGANKIKAINLSQMSNPLGQRNVVTLSKSYKWNIIFKWKLRLLVYDFFWRQFYWKCRFLHKMYLSSTKFPRAQELSSLQGGNMKALFERSPIFRFRENIQNIKIAAEATKCMIKILGYPTRTLTMGREGQTAILQNLGRTEHVWRLVVFAKTVNEYMWLQLL